jgi:glycyl-tRNA synthetase (class II)
LDKKNGWLLMAEPIDSSKILSMAKRRGFLWPSYEIYGGLAGFYDYGPLGTLLKENITTNWRKYFVYGERCADMVIYVQKLHKVCL